MTPEPALAHYHSLVAIGHGGLGDVYRATHVTTGDTVAIKVLRDVTDSSLAWHRTRRELAALTALEGHPNVVQPIELLELEQGPALVMEFAPGGSVADLMTHRAAPLTVAEVLFVGQQTAQALEAAHGRGIVHRDVKPQNLLIDAAGQVKLCDFGIAALTFDDDYRTRTNAVSMQYSSPEDLEHDLDVGPATDVYSLGATLLYLVAGVSLTLRDRLEPWVPPRVDEPVPAGLYDLIAGCLQPDPSRRPSAARLRQRLDGLVFSAGSATTRLGGRAFDDGSPRFDQSASTVYRPKRLGDPDQRPAPPEPEPATKRRPSRLLLVVAGLLSMLLVAALAVVAFWPATGVADRSAPTVTTVTTTAPVATVARSGPPVEERPDDLPDLIEVDWSAGEVGDCLVQRDDASALVVVDCAQPHDLQRLAADTLSDAGFFDATRVSETVRAECEAAFSAFVGGTPATSALDVAHTQPSPASWADGDRSYQCFTGIEGKRLTADTRTTAW